MVLFLMQLAVELLVVMGVGSCLCPSSSRVVQMTSPSRELSKNSSKYAYTADGMAFLSIGAMVGIALLCMLGFGELGLSPK